MSSDVLCPQALSIGRKCVSCVGTFKGQMDELKPPDRTTLQLKCLYFTLIKR